MIDDWLDNGTIDKQYKAACYQQALKHVPEDLRDYSNITDAISAALSASLRGDGRQRQRQRQPERRRARARGAATPTPARTASPRPSLLSRSTPRAIHNLGTTKASSLPIPLLVLAALGALLLVSAGGLAASKRLKARRPAPPR